MVGWNLELCSCCWAVGSTMLWPRTGSPGSGAVVVDWLACCRTGVLGWSGVWYLEFIEALPWFGTVNTRVGTVMVVGGCDLMGGPVANVGGHLDVEGAG